MYILLILFLYLKTRKYRWVIDDHILRKDYYWVCPPPKAPRGFDDTVRSPMATFTNIGTFILVCLLIDHLFGWKPALLYAVMPTNVGGVAWGRTGNYYMTTVFFVLAAYFFFITGTLWGLVLACILYFTALHSTVSALPFPVLCTFINPILSVPLYVVGLLFVVGKRFKHGIKIRKDYHKSLGFPSCELKWSNFIVATKVVGYYIALSTGFLPLGFFHDFGKQETSRKPTRLFFLSISTIILVALWGYTASPLGIVWFFLFIGIFCQFMAGLGQFVTERYTHIANIGVCILLANSLTYEAFIVIASVWFMITFKYIPAWRSNESLFLQGMVSFPKCPDNYSNLGSYYMDRGMHFKAIQPLSLAIMNTTGYKFNLFVNISSCFASCGYYEKALHWSREAFKMCEKDKIDDLRKQIFRLEARVRKVRENEKLLKAKGII